MTTPNQIFDAFCQKAQLGCDANCRPCVQLAGMRTESLNRIVDHDRFITNTISSKHIRPNGCHGVHLGVVQSHLLNAFAAEHLGWFLIGINRGTYHFLLSVAARMLSDRRVLPDIGDPEKELPEVPVTDLLSMEDSRLDKPLFPKSPVRDQYSHMLYEEMIQFLIFHELAHIVRGHVGFLSSPNRTGLIQEFNMAPQPGGSLASQAMEAHADMSAAELCFINSFSKHQLSQDPDCRIADDDSVNAIRKELYADKALTAMRTALAIYLLFRAFAPDSRATTRLQESELIQGSHPHPLVRQGLLMGQLYATLLDKEPDLTKGNPVGYTAIRVAENAISFASGGGECTEIPDDLRNNIELIQNHMRTLLRKIDEIKPHYARYAWPSKPIP